MVSNQPPKYVKLCLGIEALKLVRGKLGPQAPKREHFEVAKRYPRSDSGDSGGVDPQVARKWQKLTQD